MGVDLDYRHLLFLVGARNILNMHILICEGIVILAIVFIMVLVSNCRKRRNAEASLRSLNDTLNTLVVAHAHELQETKDRLGEVNRELEILSRVDALTKLYNRYHMEGRLKEEIQHFIRTGRTFSVMMVDIDNFKCVNDTYGHSVGGEVLKNVASHLRERVRKYDVVARWGGEEFLLLFPGLNKEDALLRADLIRREVEAATCTYEDKELSVTITIGVATISEEETMEEIVKRADDAMYIGKNKGKNRIVMAE